MVRYFFHTEDGRCLKDREGTELPNLESAKAEATRLMCQLLKDDYGELWATQAFSVIVTTETGLVMFRIDVAASTSAAARLYAHQAV